MYAISASRTSDSTRLKVLPTAKNASSGFFGIGGGFLIVPALIAATGMPILYEPPGDVGADRIVNGVAAFAAFGGPVIVVDFGTATTFDAVTPKGEYLGGAIAPLSVSLVIGAFVFGAVMQIADGCGSGTLYKAGLGNGFSLAVLPGFVFGSFLGAAHLDAWLDALAATD